MKKIVFMGVALFASVIVFAGCTKQTTQNQEQESSPKVEATQSPKNEAKNETINSSLKEMIAKGESVECTVVLPQEEAGGKGTMYIDGKKERVRTDMEVIIEKPSKTIQTHMIMNNDYLYTWTEGQESNGIQIKVTDEMKKEAKEMEQDVKNDSAFNMDEKMSFSCKPWSVDEKMFTPPSTVKFTDMSQIMQQAPQAAKDAVQDACAICDMVPEGQKAECKAQCK